MATSFFTELKRRNVFKVGGAYLVLAWFLIPVTVAAVPAFGMPEWVDTVVFFFCIINLGLRCNYLRQLDVHKGKEL